MKGVETSQAREEEEGLNELVGSIEFNHISLSILPSPIRQSAHIIIITSRSSCLARAFGLVFILFHRIHSSR